MSNGYKANDDKKLYREYEGREYARIPIKTHVLHNTDTIEVVTLKYVTPVVQPMDIVFISEKAVSCMQNRAIPIKDINVGWLARTLSKFVYKNPYGAGLGLPETMELTIREAGVLRILLAGAISVIGKIFGQRGWFYKVAGKKARSIDTPDAYTIPPYNEYIVLAPENPNLVAQKVAKAAGVPAAVVDVNDLGQNIMGVSDSSLSIDMLVHLLADNPLGQGNQSTPFGIIRPKS